jgi:hypothetical protein
MSSICVCRSATLIKAMGLILPGPGRFAYRDLTTQGRSKFRKPTPYRDALYGKRVASWMVSSDVL